MLLSPSICDSVPHICYRILSLHKSQIKKKHLKEDSLNMQVLCELFHLKLLVTVAFTTLSSLKLTECLSYAYIYTLKAISFKNEFHSRFTQNGKKIPKLLKIPSILKVREHVVSTKVSLHFFKSSKDNGSLHIPIPKHLS